MNSDETLEQPTAKDEILQAIAELSKKVDGLQVDFHSYKKESNIQFEAIRQGIVDNYARLDRMSAEIYEARADIYKIRANLTEFTEEARHNRKVIV